MYISIYDYIIRLYIYIIYIYIIYIYILYIYIYLCVCGHSGIYSDILSCISADTLSGIFSGIYSDILSGSIWHVFWHSIWHSIWHIFIYFPKFLLAFYLTCVRVQVHSTPSWAGDMELYLWQNLQTLLGQVGKKSHISVSWWNLGVLLRKLQAVTQSFHVACAAAFGFTHFGETSLRLCIDTWRNTLEGFVCQRSCRSSWTTWQIFNWHIGKCYSQFPQYDMLQNNIHQCLSHSSEPMESVGLAIKARQKRIFSIFFVQGSTNRSWRSDHRAPRWSGSN